MSNQRKTSKLNEFLNFSPTQDYNDIKAKFEETGHLFEDDEFVVGPAVLPNDANDKTIVINYLGKKHIRRSEIEWLRPRVS